MNESMHVRFWLTRFAAPAIALIATAAACAGAPSARGDDGVAPSLALLERQTTIDGERLPVRAGAKRTVVQFFATWCGPCRHEMSRLAELRREDPSLRIILVNDWEDWSKRSDEDRMRSYLADQGISFPVVRGGPEMRRAFGDITKIPSLFVFDESGREVAAYRRQERPMPDAAELRAALGL